MKCVKCKKRKAVISYSEGALSFSHGFVDEICRECYIELIEKELYKIKENLACQKKLLLEDNVSNHKNGK